MKKIVAREFLILLGTSILFFITLFVWIKINQWNLSNERKIKIEISNLKKQENFPYRLKIKSFVVSESLPNKIYEKRQNLYKYLKETKLTNKDFENFSNTYINEKSTIQLHQFLVDNDLTDLSQIDFHQKYFGDLAFKNIDYNDNTFVTDLKIDSTLAMRTYDLFSVLKENKISVSKEEFYTKISNDSESEKYLENINSSEIQLKKIQNSFFNKTITENSIKILILGFILVFFVLRYLIYATKWSLRQINQNG